MEPTFIGNIALLNLPKLGFLCSRNISSEAILKCYDWATSQRDKGICVISGFHSTIEKDVLHFLLKGKQPIIIVLGRAMYHQIPDELQKAMEENRLLIISPVSQKIKRYSKESAFIRNKYIVDHADQIVFSCVNESSSLFSLLQEAKIQGKAVIL